MVDDTKERDKLFFDTKKNIRALLISAPSGLTPSELEHDFRSMIGKTLPWKELKYSSAMHLLKDIPDVIQPTYVHGELVLKGVADATTEHIARLVAGQKKNSKSRTYKRKQPQIVRQTVPNYLRHQIKQLLSSFPAGLLGSKFPDAYKRRFGCSINLSKLNFNSLPQLFNAMPDLIKIETVSNSSCRLHLKTPINYQRMRSKEDEYKMDVLSDSSSDHSLEDYNYQTKPKSPVSKTQPQNNYNRPRYTPPQNSTQRTRNETQNSSKPSMDSLKKNLQSSGIDETIKNNIISVVSKRPKGIWSARLAVEYRNTYNKILDFQGMGFSSVVELAASLPEAISITRPHAGGDWMLMYIPPGGKAPVKPENEKPARLVIDQGLKERIHKVLTMNPDGVLFGALPSLFKKFYGCDIPVQGSGFNNLEPLLLAMPDAVMMKYRGEGRVFLLAKGSSSSPQPQIPSDAAGPGVQFNILEIPDSQSLGVYVTQIDNLECLWVQIVGIAEKLDNLMNDMADFYSSAEGKKYTMPNHLVKHCQICCALYPEDKGWYRALITGLPSDDQAEVSYVDYGNSKVIPREYLRLLRSDFLELPAQAVQAKLAFIKPAQGSTWSQTSIYRLHQLTADRQLYAIVCEYKNSVLSLCLCDTNTDEDIHINDLLVEEGYAQSTVPTNNKQIIRQEEDTKKNHQKTEPVKPSGPPGLTLPSAEQVQQNHSLAAKLATESASLLPTEEDLEFMQLVSEELDGIALSDESEDWLLKRIEFKNGVFHVINYDNIPHITSAELSAFFWQEDLIRSMLRQKKMNVPKVILAQEEHSKLFEELERHEVNGVTDDGKIKPFITLYQLASVGKVIDVFKPELVEEKELIAEEVERWKTEGEGYWTIKESDDTTEEGSSETASLDEQDDMEELKLYLQGLRFRRKRILESMLSGHIHTVDELSSVERDISSLQDEINRREQRNKDKTQDDQTPTGSQKDQEPRQTEQPKQTQCQEESQGQATSQGAAVSPAAASSVEKAGAVPKESMRVEAAQNPARSPADDAAVSSGNVYHKYQTLSQLTSSSPPDHKEPAVTKQSPPFSNHSSGRRSPLQQRPRPSYSSPLLSSPQFPVQSFPHMQQSIGPYGFPFESMNTMGPYAPMQAAPGYGNPCYPPHPGMPGYAVNHPGYGANQMAPYSQMNAQRQLSDALMKYKSGLSVGQHQPGPPVHMQAQGMPSYWNAGPMPGHTHAPTHNR